MKKLILLLVVASLLSCGKMRGWFPGWEGDLTQPLKGCQHDLTVHYSNNCDMNLLVYFIEVDPGTIVNCEILVYSGNLGSNLSKTFTIHKGKIGYFVFAENEEGKCSGAHRKSETWVNCSQSNGDEAFFQVCNSLVVQPFCNF